MKYLLKGFKTIQHGVTLDEFLLYSNNGKQTLYNKQNCLVDGIGALERYNECMETMKSLQQFAPFEIVEIR